MFDVQTWLFSMIKDQLMHERLSFLLTANGGPTVHGWGFISHNRGHQQGLEQDDAVQLMQLMAFIRGLEAAGVDVFGVFEPYFKNYQAKHLDVVGENHAV